MICQECQQRQATIHFTKIINGEKTEIQLCEKCSQEKSDVLLNGMNQGFSINDLLSGLLNLEQSFTQTKKESIQNHDILLCEKCHMTYPQFAQSGRFGCSECYKSFHLQLEPILKRLHSGNSTHIGKIPKRIGGNISIQKKIAELKQQMIICIQQEEFEKAAELRDEIRLLEKETQSSSERSDSNES